MHPQTLAWVPYPGYKYCHPLFGYGLSGQPIGDPKPPRAASFLGCVGHRVCRARLSYSPITTADKSAMLPELLELPLIMDARSG